MLCILFFLSSYRRPTIWGISEKECYGNASSGAVYMTGKTSTQCLPDEGSSTSMSVFESGDVPQGEHLLKNLLF